MCGIVAVGGSDRPIHHRLLASLRRRGPDGIGFWTDPQITLGHTRLAILGLDERAEQPLENETHVLVYNGEIYNFHDLHSRFAQGRKSGPPFTDSAVLLELWAARGPAILTELQGFWAFAIYDKRSHELTLVRDQFGVKPLYYAVEGGRTLAASTIRAMLDLAPEFRDLDYGALSEYARYQFTFGDKTFLKPIRKVLPGHYVTIHLPTGETTIRQYEDILRSGGDRSSVIDPAWIDETRELVRRCVSDSTISDTSFTTFCSGGIDSSLITRMASPEVAYHCNFADPECNETHFAQEVTRSTSTRLFVVNAQEEFNLVTRLRDIIEDFDELSIGSVILPLDDILSQVKRRYKVILTGTGGDELFAGYVRYQLALGECYQDSYRALFQRMSQVQGACNRFEMTHAKGESALYRFFDRDTRSRFVEAFEDCRQGDDDLSAMLRFDRRYFLQGLLNIDDRMGGRHSLESRPTFLHQALVRHLQQVPEASLLGNGTLKPVLRRVAGGVLPKSVVARTDKMGFTTPIGTFVNKSAGHIREQILGSRFRDLYDLKRLTFTAETKFSREIFGLLMLDLWLNRYACA